MKLYRLGENEIRIHLTGEDLEAYSITLDDFDYDSTKGRRVIWELFDRAREETGFDAAKEKVYIQLYPKESGGCELFVTKLEKEEDERICFLFFGPDHFLSALSLFPHTPTGASFYRDREGERYFALIPEGAAPAEITEYGERISPPPTRTYFHSHCKKVQIPNR